MLLTIMLGAIGLGAAGPTAYDLHVMITNAASQLRDRTYGPWKVVRAAPRSPALRLEIEMVRPVTETFWAEMEARLTAWQCSTEATAIFAGGGRIEIQIDDPINERRQTVTLSRCPG